MCVERFLLDLTKQLNIPYIDVVCHKDGKEVFRTFLGENVDGKEKLFMFSCSKVMTATLALRLIEDGKASLDDKVCKYLPEIANAFILDENGNKTVVGDKMLIRHLLTMTGGFTYNLYTEPVTELMKKDKNASLKDFVSKFIETPLAFAPGSRFEYSLCHDVLARVIEVVSGKKFSEFANEIIFKPLEMKNSCFDNSLSGSADMYRASPDGKIDKVDNSNYLLPTKSYESGGAGLVSSVEDYIVFADALANGGKATNGYRILKEQTLKLLTTPQLKAVSVDGGFTCVQGNDYDYGFGVRVRSTPSAWGLDEGEFGWDGAAGSYVMIDRKNKVSVFMGMNVLGWPFIFKDKHLQIVEKIYKEVLKLG